ncbi:hypothetical protein WB66_23155 [bacteria symbiont BFo1 of Frankliniella occidentalis]|nr:hypothetical protein AI28_12740 [bacteria symbiont BFo1 of Frankliniella occidentalis]KYP82426.1 hypothetical protein WB66_23155 [bacteria symbiont BFo1 of Frankliniella occidentalis]
MNEQNTAGSKPSVTFSCDDAHVCEEMIALKTFVFSILRTLPHEVSIEAVRNLVGNSNNPVLTRLCTEMTDAMLATSLPTQKN